MADVIRVLIADDDPLVRVGLGMVLGAGEDIDVVGEAGNGRAAIEAVGRLRPDVVLMDIRMPVMDGLAATEALRSAGERPAIIILTTFDTDEHILRALRAGANGFLLKDTPPLDILTAVRRVAAGDSMLSPSVTQWLIEHVVHSGDGSSGAGSSGAGSSGDETAESRRGGRARAALAGLTERERDVAMAVAAGKSNMDIAADLYMSVGTVKAYVSRILDKLDCTNRVQVAILVHEAQLE